MMQEVSHAALGRLANTVGIVGLLALVFLILFFVIGQPFGTLNDIFNGLAACVLAWFLWKLQSELQALSGPWSGVLLGLAALGAVVAVVGSYLVISGTTSYFLAGLYTSFGNSFIGIYLLALCLASARSGALPRNLAVAGIVVGVILLFGLFTIPGLIGAVDNDASAPWNLWAAQGNALSYLLLSPLWCLWLARWLSS